MLQFILGKSGTGKTTYIYNKVKELIDNGESNITVIIPDQSDFEVNKSFLDFLGAKDLKKVNIFGFSTLCRYVFEKTFQNVENVLDDGTRALIMNIALEQLTEKLSLLKSNNTKGIADILLQTLTDCKNNNVLPSDLYKASEVVEDATLKTKLYETALVLDTFDAIVSQSYIDPLDNLTRVYDILCVNNIFKDSYIFVDAFSGFTAQQLKVLRLFMSECKYMGVALTLDPLTDGREEVFATSNDTYRALKNIAKKDFVNIKSPIKLTECHKFSNDELLLLENGIFRVDSELVDYTPSNITLYFAVDYYAECEFVARQIKKLIIDDKLKYSDISVICHDTEPYKGIINVVFDKYEIPYFMDSQIDIEIKPVIRFINSIFRIIIDNFEREDVVSLLKTGLTQNSSEEISVFENYLYVWNINNSKFKLEFTNNPSGFSNSFSDDDTKTLKICEKVRKSVAEPLLRFKNDIKDKTGKEIAILLYNLLKELKVPESLSNLYDELETNGEKGLGAEQIRIWNLLMETLDKTVAVIGDMPLSAKRFYELLSIQISAIKFSKIPQTLDGVTITTAQRVRVSKQRVSFLIGCSDGVFPSVPKSSGLFSSFELKLLTLNDIKLSEDFSALDNLETFMAYSCMTSPSERLFVSYSTADMLGEQKEPSVIFGEILKIFPLLPILDRNDFDIAKDSMYAIQPAFEQYAKSVSVSNKSMQRLGEYFKQDENFGSKTFALERATDKSPFKIENPQNAENLFGENLRISASQIESFYKCKFAYFCNYGLRIRERLKADINPLEYGSLVHYIFEKFFTDFQKSDYSQMTDDDIKNYVSKVITDYLNGYFGGEESKDGSFIYKLSVLSNSANTLIKHMIEELSQSDFDVVDCELNIGNDIPSYTLKLDNGHNIAVCGSVDRVDIMKNGEETFIRIVDYKTGNKVFNLSDIMFGLNLQMLLYLYSITINGKERYGNISPAGILYMPSTAPTILLDDSTKEGALQKSINKELRMNGLLLDNIDVIKGMDKSESATYIPVKIKVGTPVSDKALASAEQFGKIFKKLEKSVKIMGEALYSGDVSATPIKGNHDSCEYCPYGTVCSYRMNDSVNSFSMKNTDVFEQLEQEFNEGGEQ